MQIPFTLPHSAPLSSLIHKLHVYGIAQFNRMDPVKLSSFPPSLSLSYTHTHTSAANTSGLHQMC